MFESFFKFFKQLNTRVKVTIAGIGIQNWSQRLSMQYNQLYAGALGADAVELGFLNSIGAAVSSIVSVPQGWAAEKYGVKKIMLLGLVCAFLSATVYALAGNWWILIPAVSLISISRLNPLADIIFVTVTNPQKRATIVSLSRVIWGILNIFAPIAAAVIVTQFGGINAQGIQPLYYIQLVLAVFIFVFIAVKLQALPRRHRKKDESGSIVQDFRELFKGEKWLKRWMALRIIRMFGISLAMPFIPLWIVNVKGATADILGVMGAASIIVSLLLQVPAGRLADRIGRKKVFLLLRPFSYLGTFLLILAPCPDYLIVVGLLGAVGLGGVAGDGIGGVSFTPFITMHWEMVPEEKRGRWFGIEGLMNAAVIPATILGGFLWQQGFMTEVLLIPILLEALVVIPILITVPDTVNRNKQ